MAKKKSKREYIWLECSDCGSRNYRTDVNTAAETAKSKLELKKYCKQERKHTVHKAKRK